MADEIKVNDRVEVFLKHLEDWRAGVVVRIDPYSAHRSFIWVQLDSEVDRRELISVLNPKNIRKI
ncbi:MAG: hypothetical protein IPM31_17135 [Anaerolineae bacterium]|nr:hypothetical protein [Anaerolineae bacterium]MBL8107478.1 hypothetical protein [Anaerolineales bacterium]MCC7190934.1 hypothetical protein [Anaerolineales bacterium]